MAQYRCCCNAKPIDFTLLSDLSRFNLIPWHDKRLSTPDYTSQASVIPDRWFDRFSWWNVSQMLPNVRFLTLWQRDISTNHWTRQTRPVSCLGNAAGAHQGLYTVPTFVRLEHVQMPVHGGWYLIHASWCKTFLLHPGLFFHKTGTTWKDG